MDLARINFAAARILEKLDRLDDIAVSVEDDIANRGDSVRSKFDHLQLSEQEKILGDLVSWVKAKERNFEKSDNRYFAGVESFQSFFLESLTGELNYMGKQIDRWDSRLKGILRTINNFHYQFQDIWDKIPRIKGNSFKSSTNIFNLQLELPVSAGTSSNELADDEKLKYLEVQQDHLLNIIQEMNQIIVATKSEIEDLNLLYLQTKGKLSDVMISMDSVKDADKAKDDLIAQLKARNELFCSDPVSVDVPSFANSLSLDMKSIFDREHQPKAHWNLVFDEVLSYYKQLEPEIRVIREVIAYNSPDAAPPRSVPPLSIALTQQVDIKGSDLCDGITLASSRCVEHGSQTEFRRRGLTHESPRNSEVDLLAVEKPVCVLEPKTVTLRIDDRSKAVAQTPEIVVLEASAQTERAYKKAATTQTECIPKPPDNPPRRPDFRLKRPRRELSVGEESVAFEVMRQEEEPREMPSIPDVAKIVKKRNCKSQRAAPPPPVAPQPPIGNPMMSVALGTPNTKNCVAPQRSGRYGVWSSGKKQQCTPLVAVKSMREAPKGQNEGMKLPHPYEIRRRWREISSEF